MRNFCIAILTVLLVAACMPEKNGVSGVYQTTQDNGAIVPLNEGKECTAPNVMDGEMCITTFQTTDTLGLFLNGEGNLDFAANLFFFNGHTCTIDGTAMKTQDGWAFESQEYNENCKLIFMADANKITLSIPDGFSCTTYCGTRGTLNGSVFPRTSKNDFNVTSKEDFACLMDVEASCPWQAE
jgi:hypothetical protein